MYVCIGITMKSHMVYVQILSVSTLVCDTIWVEYFIPAHVALLIPGLTKYPHNIRVQSSGGNSQFASIWCSDVISGVHSTFTAAAGDFRAENC